MNDIHSYVGAYVAHALDEELRIVFAEHLQDCESCSREVQEFSETLAQLSELSATPPPAALRGEVLEAISRVRIEPPDEPRHEPVVPPPSLRRNVLSAVAGTPTEPDDPVASPALPVAPQRRSIRWLQAAVAASLVLAVLFGGWAVLQQRRSAEIQQAQRSAQPAAELLQAADLQTYGFTWPDGTKGAYLVSRRLGRAMVAGAVPAIDPGRTYQLWSMRNGQPERGPTFRAGSVAVWNTDLTGAEAIAITDEPDGGSPQPTTDPLVVTAI